LAAEEGSNIANWITSDEGFYHLNSSNQKDLWLSSTGMSGTVNGITQNYAYYAKGVFGVSSGGNLVATSANITGKIVVTDSTSSMNTGTVGGWTSTGNGLQNTTSGPTLVLSPAGGATGNVAVYDSGNRNDWGIYMNGKFGVTTNGDVYMSNAHVKGDIYADSGTFNGTIVTTNMTASGTVSINNANITNGTITNAAISNGTITSATLSSCSIGAAQINSGVLNVARIPDLSADKIKAGTVNASSVEFKTADGYLTVGTNTQHPSASGLNVGSHGISFGDNSGGTSITGTTQNMTVTANTNLTLKTHGGGDAFVLQSGGITINSGINFTSYIKVGGNKGITWETFECEDLTGTPKLKIHHGIIIAVDTGNGTWHYQS